MSTEPALAVSEYPVADLERGDGIADSLDLPRKLSP